MTIKSFALATAMAALVAAGPALSQDLPPLLQGLDLGGLSVETRRDGLREYEGRLPDGTEIEARFDLAGNLVKLEADDGALPDALIQAALPEAVRAHPALAQLARITEIETDSRSLEIEGYDAEGVEMKLRFDRADRLIGAEIKRGALPQALVDEILPPAIRNSEVYGNFASIAGIRAEGDRFGLRGRDGSGARMGAQMDASGAVLRFRGDDDDDGPRARMHERMKERMQDRDEARGPDRWRGDGDRPGHARGPMGRGAPDLSIDTVAINQRLTEAGYGGFGLLHQRGPRLSLQATNPDGEPVTLELDPAGEILRETAR
ncbi:hypothetical protein [Paracoccus sp. (in: a-proteobacteria)]|uniref:hypothetical protein n=1 Tax=Paracoccus sp. TaxID=267 RepID=UPI00272BBEDD|nr:hypothetical protein [Paracoccus sp. (in: a-proteobacteria)]